MLEQLLKSKLRIGALAGCLVLIAVVSLRGASEQPRPPLDTSQPDPDGTPRMRIGQSSNVMEQPVRDASLDELLRRD